MSRIVLYAGPSGERSRALAETLRAAENEVRPVRGLRDVLLLAENAADVLVLDAADEGGIRDLFMLEEIQRAGITLPVILVTTQTDFELSQRARELGAEVVLQGALDPAELVRAVERIPEGRPEPSPTGERHEPASTLTHRVEYDVRTDALRDAVRDLTAYLARRAVCLPHLVRIACATAELIDNARRHAHIGSPGGVFQVEARVETRRVYVSVTDDGAGFDTRTQLLESVPAALPARRPSAADRTRSSVRPGTERGLSRATYLADHVELHSDADGANVQLDFELVPVRSEGTLPATDDLLPEHTKSWLGAIARGEDPKLPEAFSLTARRLTGETRTHTPVIQRG